MLFIFKYMFDSGSNLNHSKGTN